MSGKSRVILIGVVLAFLVALLRFVPAVHISANLADFAVGLAVGLLIGFLITWAGERKPRE